jgi:predicted solute-binding protein
LRPGWKGGEEIEKFRRACRVGIEKRGDLAENEAEREYLTECIRYELGEEEKEGMREFARRGGLRDPEIEWV